MKPPVVANELIWWSASVNTRGKSNTPNGWNCDWEFKLYHVSISQTTWQIAFGFFDCSIDLRSTNYQVCFDISSFLHLSKNTFFSNQSNWAFQKCFLRNSIIMLKIFEKVDFEIKNVSAKSSLKIPSRTSKSCLVLPSFISHSSIFSPRIHQSIKEMYWKLAWNFTFAAFFISVLKKGFPVFITTTFGLIFDAIVKDHTQNCF